jgi:DNA primase
VPFVVFHVDRILERADKRSAEGKDRALSELAPLLRDVPASVLREELLRRVAGALDLSEATLSSLVLKRSMPTAPQKNGGGRVQLPSRDQGARTERTFLALCIALPGPGREALQSIDPDELLTSETLRRAARHIATRTDAPLAELPGDDEQLAHVVADLVARAGRTPALSEARLEHARLVLELARLDRAIRRGRAGRGGDIAALAREREGVLEGIRKAVGRLE